jgi:hypothetical protein
MRSRHGYARERHTRDCLHVHTCRVLEEPQRTSAQERQRQLVLETSDVFVLHMSEGAETWANGMVLRANAT